MTAIEHNTKPEEEGYEGVQTPLRRFLSDFCEAKLAVIGFFYHNNYSVTCNHGSIYRANRSVRSSNG
jgi:hypothetical protein